MVGLEDIVILLNIEMLRIVVRLGVVFIYLVVFYFSLRCVVFGDLRGLERLLRILLFFRLEEGFLGEGGFGCFCLV